MEAEMTSAILEAPARARSIARSIVAVLVGIVTAAALSLAADQVLHVLHVFRPWGEATYTAGPFALAVAYRGAFGVLGFYVTARLAPRHPTRHVRIAAAVALVPALGGVMAALTSNMGPVWYPVALVLTIVPCAWVADRLHRRGQHLR